MSADYRRWLTLDGPVSEPLTWLDHRGEEFDVERVEWRVMVLDPEMNLHVQTVLIGTGRDGGRTNAIERSGYTATGSPLWHEYAPQPPHWFHLAAAAFIRAHDPDPDLAPVSSQAGLSTIRPTITPGGAA